MKIKFKKAIIRFFIYLFLSYLWFYFSYLFIRYRPSPYYDNLKELYYKIKKKPILDLTINEKRSFNAKKIITIKNVYDLEVKREKLKNFIYGEKKLIDLKNLKIEKNIKDKVFNGLNNLDKIDKLIYEMESGINSISYHFKPLNKKNKLIIIHEGNRGNYYSKKELGNFSNSKKEINYFLKKGFDVFALSLPLQGINNRPEVYVKNIGIIKLDKTFKLKFLDQTYKSHFIRYFLEPIEALTDYAKNYFDFENISMVGISSGGWVTMLSSATNENIQFSFSVAGSLPLSLQNSDIGNSKVFFEQIDPSFYKEFNYLDLYLLSSTTTKNKYFTQIFNKHDSVRFNGERYKLYEKDVKKIVKYFGYGNFEIYIDENNYGHKISRRTLDYIFKKINLLGKN